MDAKTVWTLVGLAVVILASALVLGYTHGRSGGITDACSYHCRVHFGDDSARIGWELQYHDARQTYQSVGCRCYSRQGLAHTMRPDAGAGVTP